LADAEAMLALKELMDKLGSPHRDCRQDGAKIDPSARAGYLFSTTIAGIEDADACLLIGTDPRWEAPLVNARLRKRWLMGGFSVGLVGEPRDFTYKTEHLGAGPRTLAEIAGGSHAFAKVLQQAERPMLILGQGALARPDGASILGLARKIADGCGMIRDGWNGFNMLHRAAGRVGGLDLGFVPGAKGRDVAGILAGAKGGDIDVVYLLGADEIDMAELGDAFVVYQGHHGDAGAHRADVILPGAAYTEKSGTYVNTEGRVQRTGLAVFPPGEAREDWKILRALSETLGQTLPYDTLEQVRARLGEVNAVFRTIDAVEAADWAAFGGDPGAIADAPFVRPVQNYYMTDPISRASETMAQCTALYVNGGEKRTGTDG